MPQNPRKTPTLVGYCTTHVGRIRQRNEDAFVSAPDIGLWLVADGVGGHNAGHVASALVCRSVLELVRTGDNLVDAIGAAHAAVIKCAGSSLEFAGMASTVVAIKADDVGYEICWVGDSRAYLWSSQQAKSGLRQLTQDHTILNDLRGPPNASDKLEESPLAGVLSQAIGAARLNLKVGRISERWKNGQRIILCSDGLTKEVSADVIATYCATLAEPALLANALVSAAVEAGGRDNVTVAAISGPVKPSFFSRLIGV